MPNTLSLTSAQFSEALTNQSLQITRMIHAAIMSGPLLFLLIAVAISTQQMESPPPAASDMNIMNILSLVHGIFFLLAAMLAQFLAGAIFSPDRLGQDTESISPEMLAARCVSLQRAADIARLAALEGASLFGTAVCFVGVTNHVMQVEPSYWFNAVSTGLFLAYGVTTFPTRQSLTDWFEARISQRTA